MEIIAAVAIGLNPFIGAFILLALAASTSRLPETAMLGTIPGPLLFGLAALFGFAAPVDFVLGKFVRFAPRARRLSQFVAPFAGGAAAATLTQSELPRAVVFAAGAAISWSVAAMITALAARGSRSHAWAGLGHVPILMAVATTAACIVPLALANETVGMVLALSAFAVLSLSVVFSGELLGRRSVPLAPAVAGRPVLRSAGRSRSVGRSVAPIGRMAVATRLPAR